MCRHRPVAATVANAELATASGYLDSNSGSPEAIRRYPQVSIAFTSGYYLEARTRVFKRLVSEGARSPCAVSSLLSVSQQ